MENTHENENLNNETAAPEENNYVPRPAWQVWMARLGLVLMISLLPWPVTHLVGRIAGMLLLPIGLLIWFLFVSAQLDKYVNPVHFPELVKRGMYQEIKDNTEKEELCD